MFNKKITLKMENFDESILFQNGVDVLGYLSDQKHQEDLMHEVERFGDKELTNRYRKLFNGDANETSGVNVLKKLFNENEQIKLVKESIAQNNFYYVEKLLKKKDVYWFVEKLIAETQNNKLINLLLSRRIGWAAQNVIVEYNNPKWTLALVKKQSDLSAYAKSYIIKNADDKAILILAKSPLLSFSERDEIIANKRFEAIKVMLSCSKERLPDEMYFKIVKLNNDEITKCIINNCHPSDEVAAFIIRNTRNHEFAKMLIQKKKPGTLTQKAIINLNNAELIRLLAKQKVKSYPFYVYIAETLNFSLMKEFIGNINNLGKKEKKYIFSSGNEKMIELIKALS